MRKPLTPVERATPAVLIGRPDRNLCVRLLLPGAAVILLEIAEGVAGGLVGGPAPARRRHGLLVGAVEQLYAKLIGGDLRTLGAVSQIAASEFAG